MFKNLDGKVTLILDAAEFERIQIDEDIDQTEAIGRLVDELTPLLYDSEDQPYPFSVQILDENGGVLASINLSQDSMD